MHLYIIYICFTYAYHNTYIVMHLFSLSMYVLGFFRIDGEDEEHTSGIGSKGVESQGLS